MKVRFTRPAFADLSGILSYVGEKSPQGARKIQDKVDALTELLAIQPYLGKQTEDPTIRRVVAMPYPYLIFYQILNDEILVHAVRHAARDPASMPGAKVPGH